MTRSALWLENQRIRLIARRQMRRLFHGDYLTPKARRAFSAAAKRRTP